MVPNTDQKIMGTVLFLIANYSKRTLQGYKTRPLILQLSQPKCEKSRIYLQPLETSL